MTKYIAFLRGINVGNIRIKMPDLKAAFERMNCTEVKTFLQSGNVVFNSEKTVQDIKSTLEKGLTETFNYDAYVLIYAFDSLSDIIAQYPFERDENHHAYVLFVQNAVIFDELALFASNLGDESKRVQLGKTALYWRVETGQTLETVFAKTLAKAKYKKYITVRNLNTLEKMI
jgi:uncharacterized protein (DUF1697 family)